MRRQMFFIDIRPGLGHNFSFADMVHSSKHHYYTVEPGPLHTAKHNYCWQLGSNN